MKFEEEGIFFPGN